jgi:hypothetical protein
MHILELAVLAWNECTLAYRLASVAHLLYAPYYLL